ncbi:hypothetical protein FB567DRAFT_587038 [Paraphoma chrysanthemicola]|uniref:Uncharacterized protein n=1 Tax=Paraphoma chrysanthemicola TaxID=798071 RepID=A0A8K0RIQ2_9PLEO|nr:hypothetical protein FB567DRAFT_587038 [Paraphoma chrysanthemicola]
MAMADGLRAKNPDIEKTWIAFALLGKVGVADDFRALAVTLLVRLVTGADLSVDGGHCANA